MQNSVPASIPAARLIQNSAAARDLMLVLLFVAHARELFRKEGGDLATLQAQPIIAALTVAFSMLSAELERNRALASQWLGRPDGADGQD